MAVAITAEEPRSVSETLHAYEDYLLREGMATSSIRTYKGRVKIVLEVCCERGWDPRALTVDQVRWLAERFSPGWSAQSTLKYALAHFWSMCGVDGPLSAIRLPSKPAARYRGLEPDEARRLERAALEAGYMRGTAVLVGLYLALRREELVKLRWSDFNETLEWVQITGKGRRTRFIPVAPVLRRELRPHRVGVGWVFPSRSGTRTYLHPGTFYNWLAELAESAGIGHVHPHALRHTALATMNDTTGDLRTTQAFAGHARIESTVGYTRATKTKLQAAVASLDYSREAS